jgi:asparagine synthase (glutamine-hydrolysing)|tara:strand:- start:49 stop:1110 length:1062 start_codon:yes stop_codon:yes gene_type:complete
LVNNLNQTLQNEKNVCVTLSSGIDSTLMTTILKNNFPEKNIHAISIKFSDSTDETESAKLIADRLDIDHHVTYVENFFENLPEQIGIVNAPFWDLHWFHVAKKAETISSNLISGDGGDELFGGYTFRYEKYLSKITEKNTIDEKIKLYLSCHERDWVPDQADVFGKKIKFSWDEIYDLLRPKFDNKLSLIDQIYLADFNGKLLYNMIPLYEKFHSHYNLKYSAPLLFENVISFSSKLPSSLKYNHSEKIGKILLRKLLQKYKIDDLILKQKQGFSVNTINLWKNYGQKISKYFLENSRIVSDGWVNSDWISKYINKNDLEIRYINKFYGLLAFEIWYRIFVTKEMRNDEKLLI